MKEYKRWLAAANIPFVDHQGRRADLHALRHTFGTMLSKSGMMPREAMELIRHSEMRLTMKAYTDHRAFDLAHAVEKLPAIAVSVAPRSEPADAMQVSRAIYDDKNRVANEEQSLPFSAF